MRRSARRRFSRRTSKSALDLIWVPIIPSPLTVTEVGQSTDLLTQTDWESQFAGLGLERATLKRVVGTLVWYQTAAGTDATGPAMQMTMQLIDDAVTAIPDINARAGVGQLETLWMWSRMLYGTTLANNPADQYIEFDIKANRKLTTQRVLVLNAKINTDAASPSCILRCYGRALVSR